MFKVEHHINGRVGGLATRGVNKIKDRSEYNIFFGNLNKLAGSMFCIVCREWEIAYKISHKSKLLYYTELYILNLKFDIRPAFE